ncbi:hypothetical protein MLD55_01525 [Alcanivorax sp. MM125-6]|nr:hypothetical protein [Alcanivorax sp. MM125-6]
MKLAYFFSIMLACGLLAGCGDGFSEPSDAFGKYVTAKEVVVSEYYENEGEFGEILKSEPDTNPIELRLGEKTIDLEPLFSNAGKIQYKIKGNLLRVYSGDMETMTLLRKDGDTYLVSSGLFGTSDGDKRTLFLLEKVD